MTIPAMCEELTTLTDEFHEARKALAAAFIAFEHKKHKVRNELYIRKMAGEKFTEEQIRSASNVECAEEMKAFEIANAVCDSARETMLSFRANLAAATK